MTGAERIRELEIGWLARSLEQLTLERYRRRGRVAEASARNDAMPLTRRLAEAELAATEYSISAATSRLEELLSNQEGRPG